MRDYLEPNIKVTRLFPFQHKKSELTRKLDNEHSEEKYKNTFPKEIPTFGKKQKGTWPILTHGKGYLEKGKQFRKEKRKQKGSGASYSKINFEDFNIQVVELDESENEREEGNSESMNFKKGRGSNEEKRDFMSKNEKMAQLLKEYKNTSRENSDTSEKGEGSPNGTGKPRMIAVGKGERALKEMKMGLGVLGDSSLGFGKKEYQNELKLVEEESMEENKARFVEERQRNREWISLNERGDRGLVVKLSDSSLIKVNEVKTSSGGQDFNEVELDLVEGDNNHRRKGRISVNKGVGMGKDENSSGSNWQINQSSSRENFLIPKKESVSVEYY